MTNHKRVLDLLMKPYWRTTDIKDYLTESGGKCSKEIAIKLRNQAAKAGGNVPYRPHAALVDSVLKLLQKDRVEEVKLIKIILENQETI